MPLAVTRQSKNTEPAIETKSPPLRIFSGSAHVPLAEDIAQHLGLKLGAIIRKQFADGELYVQVQESVRGCAVYLVQPTCDSVNTRLMELLIMIDACRRASARQVTIVTPYYGYARADRKTAGRESITAKLVANLLTEAGADRLIAMDLHSPQIEGYFDIPVDHVYGAPVLVNYLLEKKLPDVVVASPDVGGVARARAFAKKLNDAPLIIIQQQEATHNTKEQMTVIGEVSGKTAVLVDDLIDTGKTLFAAAKALRQAGATQVYACATHAVFSPQAIDRLSSGLLEQVIVTNTIPIPATKQFPQLTILSIAHVFSEAIRRIHEESQTDP